MKKSVGACLKLMLHFLRNDEFKSTEENDSQYPQSRSYWELSFVSERVRVLLSENKMRRTNNIESTTYGSVMYSDLILSFKKDLVSLETRTFPNKYREIVLPIQIQDKDEFFNYMLENDIDYLKFEDLETVRKIIKDLDEKRTNFMKNS